MNEILNLINGKNYSRITPLFRLNTMSIIVFGPCLTFLLNTNNEKWYIFLLIMLLPFLYTIIKYEFYSCKKPEFLDTENFKLNNRKYDLLGEKTKEISINTTLNIEENGEL